MPSGKKQRGRLTTLPERQEYIAWINEAVQNGARKKCACSEIGISIRTLQRWLQKNEDGRKNAVRPAPTNKLRILVNWIADSGLLDHKNQKIFLTSVM